MCFLTDLDGQIKEYQVLPFKGINNFVNNLWQSYD